MRGGRRTVRHPDRPPQTGKELGKVGLEGPSLLFPQKSDAQREN